MQKEMPRRTYWGICTGRRALSMLHEGHKKERHLRAHTHTHTQSLPEMTRQSSWGDWEMTYDLRLQNSKSQKCKPIHYTQALMSPQKAVREGLEVDGKDVYEKRALKKTQKLIWSRKGIRHGRLRKKKKYQHKKTKTVLSHQYKLHWLTVLIFTSPLHQMSLKYD